MRILLLFLIHSISLVSFSQNIIISGSIGYNTNISDPIFINSYDEKNYPENHRNSFAKGYSIGLDLAYSFNQNCDLFFSYYYLMGNSYSYRSNGGNGFMIDNNFTGEQTLLVPGIKYKISGSNINEYFKIGPSIGFNTINRDYKVVNINSLKAEITYEKKTTIGLFYGFGIDYNYSERLVMFCEVNGSNHIYSPDKLKVRYNDIGQEEYNLIDNYDKKTGKNMLKNDFSFNYIGFNLGLRVNINN